MDAASVGLVGVLSGLVVSKTYDTLFERERRHREDRVWHRQHALGLAAAFLAATAELETRRQYLEVVEVTERAAERASHQDVGRLLNLRSQRASAREDVKTADEEARRALMALSILLQRETFEWAKRYLEGVSARHEAADDAR
jgi:hypothetical protein